jgi:hypothetical protein
MVENIMTRHYRNAIRTNGTAAAVPARAFLVPGTLVFLS